MEFETRAIHAGQEPDPATGSVTTPIYQTSTFAQEAVGVNKGYDYARVANPTRTALEECLASLEGAAHGHAFSSGLGATTTLMHLVDPGRRIVCVNDVYGGVYRMFSQVYEPKGYRFTWLSAAELSEQLAAHLDDEVALRLARNADEPAAQRRRHSRRSRGGPRRRRARRRRQHLRDAVLAAAALARRRRRPPFDDEVPRGPLRRHRRLRRDERRRRRGASSLPPEVPWRRPRPVRRWLVLRGLKTLAVRMRQHCENARAVAALLDRSPPRRARPLPGAPRPSRARARGAADARLRRA